MEKYYLSNIALALVLLLGLAQPTFCAPTSSPDATENNFKSLIDQLDSQAKQTQDIDEAMGIALQAQSARKSLAGHYHKLGQYRKIIPIYESIIERDKQFVHMGRMDTNELGLDYRYVADLYSYLDQAELAEKFYKKALEETKGADNVSTRRGYAAFLRKLNRTEEAAQAEADAGPTTKPTASATTKPTAKPTTNTTKATTNKTAVQTASVHPDFAGVEKVCQQARQFVKKGDFVAARTEFEKAISMLSTEVEPEVRRKMLAHVPGYTLDRWHACMLKEAAVQKELAEVAYKLGNLDSVREAYEAIIVLKNSGGAPEEEKEADYAYLITLCEAGKDQKKAELYHIALLRARRSHLGDSDATVLDAMDKFAKYMRNIGETEKASQLEARAKATRTNSKPFPKLWFSY